MEATQFQSITKWCVPTSTFGTCSIRSKKRRADGKRGNSALASHQNLKLSGGKTKVASRSAPIPGCETSKPGCAVGAGQVWRLLSISSACDVDERM